MKNKELIKLKKSINSELNSYIHALHLKKTSPIMFKHLKEISLREGKRIRPMLFVLSYLGHSRRPAQGYLTSAVALELIQSFILVHDDIVDRSELRRGLPTLHKMIEKDIAKKPARFTGKDAAMIVGDVIFALGIKTFLSIEEDPARKTKALHALLESALFTGCGQVNELWHSIKGIEHVTEREIFDIYDQKTGNYTFVLPLTLGAILAGQEKSELNKIAGLGKSLGRAFQIQDDLSESVLNDLRESKKTILALFAYQGSEGHDKKAIRHLLAKKMINRLDLKTMQAIMKGTGARERAIDEVHSLVEDARKRIDGLMMKEHYRDLLLAMIDEVFPKA